MIEILIDKGAVEERIGGLAGQLVADYGDESPVFIGVLNGAVQFMMDLIGQLPAEIQERLDYDFVDVSSYDGGTSRGEVTVNKEIAIEIEGRDVVVVDGIVDTGLTLELVLSMLEKRKPKSLRVCTLLDTPSRRQREVPVDYCGFTIEDRFVVGYGMDLDQRYRALRYIGVLE